MITLHSRVTRRIVVNGRDLGDFTFAEVRELHMQLGIELSEHRDQLVALLNFTAHFFSLPLEALTCRCRDERFAWPRMVAMFVATELIGANSFQVGEIFKRTPSDVRHAVVRVRDRRDTDIKTRQELDRFTLALRAIHPATEPSHA